VCEREREREREIRREIGWVRVREAEKERGGEGGRESVCARCYRERL